MSTADSTAGNGCVAARVAGDSREWFFLLWGSGTCLHSVELGLHPVELGILVGDFVMRHLQLILQLALHLLCTSLCRPVKLLAHLERVLKV